VATVVCYSIEKNNQRSKMSKVGEFAREIQELNSDQFPDPTEQEMIEPTDDELHEIESKLNQTAFEDIEWD